MMCDNKNHPLIEIYRSGYLDYEQDVVRWCPECGAIVIDTEYDGRIKAGAIMKMKFVEEKK